MHRRACRRGAEASDGGPVDTIESAAGRVDFTDNRDIDVSSLLSTRAASVVKTPHPSLVVAAGIDGIISYCNHINNDDLTGLLYDRSSLNLRMNQQEGAIYSRCAEGTGGGG